MKLYRASKGYSTVWTFIVDRIDEKFYYVRSNETGLDLPKPLHTYGTSCFLTKEQALEYVYKSYLIIEKELMDKLSENNKRILEAKQAIEQRQTELSQKFVAGG